MKKLTSHTPEPLSEAFGKPHRHSEVLSSNPALHGAPTT